MTLTIALSVVLALLFVATGAGKLFGAKASLEARDQFRMNPALWRTIGALEWAGAAGLVAGLASWDWLGRAATVGLGLLMAGATITRLRFDSKPTGVVLDLVLLALLILLLFLDR
ncbi:DoxX-like family protein [Lentzea fradiae]|uniref:DoxX-like family protein n=1 Tax=Lentzea fradiae TaxID=200378 RepID=A0A1G7T9C3_9PSEU|nr:DoxX family protein [Lentzea fradiae]SDG31200.1 DoxX-like family protein [Lentzea fradiae]